MNSLEQATTLLMDQWGTKTLEALRQQAKAEPTGVMFDAIRVAGGKRVMLVICATKRDQIAVLQKAFDFADDGPPQDWTKLTLLEIAMRAAAGPGLGFESLRNDAGELSEVILISTEPRSMTMIERVFTMPK